jgi:hypothetical protein
MQEVEVRGVHGSVHLAPRDVSLGRRLPNDKFIVRRATCVLAGATSQGATVREHTFLPAQRFFVKSGRRQIPLHGIGLDSLALEAETSLNFRTHPRLQSLEERLDTQNHESYRLDDPKSTMGILMR